LPGRWNRHVEIAVLADVELTARNVKARAIRLKSDVAIAQEHTRWGCNLPSEKDDILPAVPKINR